MQRQRRKAGPRGHKALPSAACWERAPALRVYIAGKPQGDPARGPESKPEHQDSWQKPHFYQRPANCCWTPGPSSLEVILNTQGISLKDAIIHSWIWTRVYDIQSCHIISSFRWLGPCRTFLIQQGCLVKYDFLIEWMPAGLRGKHHFKHTVAYNEGLVPKPPDDFVAHRPLFAASLPAHPHNQIISVYFFTTSDCDQYFLYGEDQCFCLPCVLLFSLCILAFRCQATSDLKAVL